MKKLYSLFATAAIAFVLNAQTTVNYVFADKGFANQEVITGDAIDANLEYTVQQNTPAQSVTYYTSGSAARMYSERNSGDGNSITITPLNGAVINSLTINALTNYTPTVTYSVDGGAFQTAALSGTTYTITGLTAESSVVFKNAHSGGSSNTQLRIPSFSVTYTEDVLAVNDAVSSKSILVKNTVVAEELSFAAKTAVQIINMNGQVVKTANVSENSKLNVSDLAKGVYIVRGTVNGKTATQKIIKK